MDGALSFLDTIDAMSDNLSAISRWCWGSAPSEAGGRRSRPSLEVDRCADCLGTVGNAQHVTATARRGTRPGILLVVSPTLPTHRQSKAGTV